MYLFNEVSHGYPNSSIFTHPKQESFLLLKSCTNPLVCAIPRSTPTHTYCFIFMRMTASQHPPPLCTAWVRLWTTTPIHSSERPRSAPSQYLLAIHYPLSVLGWRQYEWTQSSRIVFQFSTLDSTLLLLHSLPQQASCLGRRCFDPSMSHPTLWFMSLLWVNPESVFPAQHSQRRWKFMFMVVGGSPGIVQHTP